MRTARIALVLALSTLALVVFSGCTMTDGGDDVLLRVKLSGTQVQAVEVADRGPAGEFDDALRPQMDGDMGVIWTDGTGETLDEGWVACAKDTTEVYVLVPAPTGRQGLITITIPTDSGPQVVSRQLRM